MGTTNSELQLWEIFTVCIKGMASPGPTLSTAHNYGCGNESSESLGDGRQPHISSVAWGHRWSS